jgi:hypothetical protein
MRSKSSFILLIIPVIIAAASSAPVPHTPEGRPDFTGVWETRLVNDFAKGDERSIPYTTAGHEAWKNVDLKNDPLFACLFPGVPRIMFSGFPIQVVQQPGLIVILFEFMRLWRTIPLDGRTHPARMEPAFLGDSTGTWEGDTLVVDTVSLKGTPSIWLDPVGHQSSDALHVTERLTRTPEGIQYRAIIDDPKMYSKPWPVRDILLKPVKPSPGLGDLMEFVCNENKRDLEHMVSTKTIDPEWDLTRPRYVLRQHAILFGGIALVGMATVLGALAWLRGWLLARTRK